MPESKPRSLYLATSIEDLDEKYNIPDVKKKSAIMLCRSANTVFGKAEDEKMKGDEEISYVMFMKFLVLVQHIKNAPDYDKEKDFVNSMIGVSKCKKALDYARTLKDSLILRYELQNKARHLMSKENKKDLEVKIQERIKMIPEENVQIPNHFDSFDISITPLQLFNLIHDKSKNILILDIRPSSCYDESHIKYENCISIPEERIIAGTSANSLGKDIPESSKPLWHERGSKDLIIIYDWNSIDFIPGKPMHILKTILLKWDPNVIYPHSPIALGGGYENWLNTYPTLTTNPHVAVPERVNDLDDFLNDIEYPALQEISPIENVNIDRSIKPNNNYILPTSNYPSVDRRSKAAAIQTYEERAKSVKVLLEEQEKIAGTSLDIEKQRVLAEEKWEELRKNSDVKTENDTVANQLREQELLSEIMQLESAQRDMALENQQLRNQLEEYKKKETDDTKTTDSSPEHKSDKMSSSSISSLSDESLNETNNGNVDKNENDWNKSVEALDKEKRIKDMEKEKIELAKKRETMQADREKILADAREQKKLLYQKQEEEEENEMNRSDLSPDLIKARQTSEVPHFDRTTKPSQNTQIFTRERDFGDRREKTSPGLTGLKNMGFTCYMNSIMQCLNNTSHLSDYFCEGQYRKHINYGSRNDRDREGHTNGMIAEEVAAVIQTLWSGQYRFISTRDLKNVVGKYKAMFRGIEQHDSHEFLTILIDWLHNDLQIPIKQQMENLSPADKAWLEYTKSKESLILRLFYGQTRSTVTCLLCGKKSVTYNSFSNLSLGLPADNSNRYSLRDCLRLYLGGEEIPDWDCPSCKNKRRASIKLDISKLPPVLIIHFNRFYQDYSTNSYKKKQTYIDFPLDNLVLKSCQDDKEVNYSLYGVSNHYGTMEGGHYTAYCKSSYHKSWYKFDDHLVASISSSDVRSSAAYILFYTSLKDSAFKNK